MEPVCHSLYTKKRGASLSLVPRSKGSRIAQLVETSNAESPTPMSIYNPPSAPCGQDTLRAIPIKHPWGVPVALFLTNCLNLRDSYYVKTKASVTPFMYIHSHPSVPMKGVRREGNAANVINIRQ